MTDTNETGQDIELTGKSGAIYEGKIYSDKDSSSAYSSAVVVCLSNSAFTEDGWLHSISDIYDAPSARQALDHFNERDDKSHIILLPKNSLPNDRDVIDDLRRNYIHR